MPQTNLKPALRLVAAPLLCLLAPAAPALAGGAHAVDGDFADWASIAPVASDPFGDSSNAFDLTSLSLDNEGSVLFLRFDTSVVRNLPDGAGSDGDIVITITLPSSQDLTLDLRSRSAWLGSPGNSQNWVALGWATSPTFAADEFEAKVDLGAVGVSPGDTVAVSFSGSDSFDSGPVNYVMSGAAVTPTRRSPDKLPDTTFRIASVNTLSSGLLNGSRRPAHERLIDAVDANVYCFQEEYNDSANSVASLLNALDPLGDGATWSVRKHGDSMIAARGSIIGVTELDNGYCAAIVEPVPGVFALILSNHLKCCGYIGSSEDTQRIGQANSMAQTIASVRNAAPGSALEPYKDAPVIVIGDANLVGSSQPTDVLAQPTPGLSRWILNNLIGESIVTWRSASSSFWPGTLDVLLHSPELTRMNGFLLDTGDLTGAEAAALGVNISDSETATDHLMLVADFRLGASGLVGDINGDCVVDTADLGILLGEFLTAGPAGSDLNGDGVVDTADLGLLLGAFGSMCP
ncbi:MAG: hypothetical protein H6814_05760 [Phycisphaeraceae bacterium]|nr:hypothetical protein [Phycisphaeraceae bacterium]